MFFAFFSLQHLTNAVQVRLTRTSGASIHSTDEDLSVGPRRWVIRPAALVFSGRHVSIVRASHIIECNKQATKI
jgi:hypothetical protein